MAVKKRRILSREEVFAAKDIEEREVYVPQWDGYVVIRTFTKKQVSAINKRATRYDHVLKKDVTDNDMVEAMLFTEGVVDPPFTIEDYDRLQEKSVAALVTIVRAINDASGLSDEAATEADKSTETRSGAPLRVLSGSRTQDDESGVDGADVGQ
jgi:hypothetical protein